MARKDKNLKRDIFEATTDKIIPQHLGKTIEENQLAYSELVITGRAIPSLFDGLKPVNRRILFSFKNSNVINKNIKSARIIGEVIGKFHPHGDQAVYGSLVEMTQVFKNKFPLTIGQGNWGTIEGDSEAAMRYTEVKLNGDMQDLLFDNLEKDGVVSWTKNYDDTLEEPQILSTKYPIALLNGSFGIAYAGITTRIPSYNIKDLTNLYIYLIENKFWLKEFDLESHKTNIKKIVPSVDLPTGCNIFFEEDDSLDDMLFKPEFSFGMRANYQIDEKANTITFFNIPINVTADKIKEEIKNAGLSYRIDNNKKKVDKLPSEILNITENADIVPISSYNDTDYKNDCEISVQFKKGSDLDLELIKLFKYTSLNSSYRAKMTFIDENTCPVKLSLLEQSMKFLNFRLHTFYKSFQFDIEKLNKQLHLLYGLQTIQKDLDKFIKIVRNNDDDEIYKLVKKEFKLDDIQIEYLLNIQLRKLSKTSVEKLENEINEKESKRDDLIEKISSKTKLFNVVKEDYQEQLTKSYLRSKKSNRLTKIIKASSKIDPEDLIQDKEVIIMYMEDDTIAYVPKNKFKLKNKGTKTTTNKINNDFELNLKISEACNLKDDILLMTNLGKVFKVKTFMFSEQFRYIGNILNLDKDEKVVNIIPYDENDKFYCIATKNGKIKGVKKDLFKNVTSNRPIKSITLQEKDKVISFIPYQKKEDNEKVMLLTDKGRIMKYSTKEISVIAGAGKGSKACNLDDNKEKVLNVFIFIETNTTCVIGVSDIGKGKKTLTEKISDKKRVNAPNLFFNNNNENGVLVCGEIFTDVENETLMLLTEKADISLIKLNNFTPVSRAAKGSVILLKMDEHEKIKTCKKLKIEDLSETQTQILTEVNDEDTTS